MFKVRQLLGKYRIERKVAEGGFANVYQALDTIEGLRVALKIPPPRIVTPEVLEDFRNEVRMTARLDHPNIIPLKNASFIDGHFVIVLPLGERTLAERLQSRISVRSALDYAEQLLSAVAYAHHHKIVHCDIKPDNLLLFHNHRLRLTDFGIARVAQRTIRAEGEGTMGYIAPEQAMGKPSFRSDVFSCGLIIYRMLSGHLPDYPFQWPPPGIERLRQNVPANFIELLRKSIEIDPRNRFADAGKMLEAFLRLKPAALRHSGRKRLGHKTKTTKGTTAARDWQAIRKQQFQRQFGRQLQTKYHCHRCDGPVAESMHYCPWCAGSRHEHPQETSFPQRCPRCRRGMKLDWHYCPWCYGPGFELQTSRKYDDVRYTARCASAACTRKVLMPFMRYCPWCHRKVRRKWRITESNDTCRSCGWGVLAAYWSFCPWCGKRIASR